MTGSAERHWRDLRPSAAGRHRLDASIRREPYDAGRDLRRPRRSLRPKLRTTSR